MDPDVEDRRKFAAFATFMFYDPLLFLNAVLPRFWKSWGEDEVR